MGLKRWYASTPPLERIYLLIGGVAVASAIGVLVYAAVQDEPSHAYPPDSTAASTTPPPTTTTMPSTTPWVPPAADDAVCTTEGAVPWQVNNPPYEGLGPHYVRLITEPVRRQASHEGIETSEDIRLPDRLSQPRPDPRGYQLVACLVALRPGAQQGTITCEFDIPESTETFPFREASYEFIVREARTARTITTFVVPGTVDAQNSCPSYVTDTGHTAIVSALDAEVLAQALEPLITKPAP